MSVESNGGVTGKGFIKGKSGNPGGRAKKTQEELDLVAACKAKTQDALDVILEIMHKGDNERNRIAAAVHIIERAYGKAVQPTENNHTGQMDSHIEWVIVNADTGST